MSQFDRQALDHLKKLCRIDCTEEEEADILHSLKRVLEYVGQLNEVETEGVKPCSFVLSSMAKNELREDVVKDTMPREQFLDLAPDQIAGMIRVPPIIKTL